MAIAYSDTGNGFPVVLIHGFCETNSIWDGFIPELSKKYRILSPDLPGFGNSPLPEGEFSIDDIAEIVCEWLDALGISETVVIGHSLGGYVTLAMADRHPEMLKGFGLFHSTAFADDAEKRSSRNKVIEFVKDKGVEVFATSFVPQLFFHKNRNALKADVDRAVETAAKTPLETLVAYTRAMRDRHDRADVLKTFNQPVLFIAGEQDASVPIEKTDEQILLPHKAIVHIYDQVAHMGMFEAKQESLQALKQYLEHVID
ncbi:hydrolase of the alpha/beta superfamily [Fulvivirga imtechensis AK7]|uniref:Hydrolase of the alpha/beta superfamily n=1 Tax=Fulvivirga imtechensis AK7 TaxID=1237149 RepID=L8JPB6_9BACT|nr:alpha/beta hydrolase [Fulvivirga imtechensis]ELR70685.1 hydrolase of the alpha/beta superfamily [Fulvivirga imtechensis AK7]